MLAVCGGELDMLDMELMRRGDIDRLHGRVGAQSFRVRIDLGAEFRGKALAGVGPGIAGCDHLDARMRREGRQHQGEGAP